MVGALSVTPVRPSVHTYVLTKTLQEKVIIKYYGRYQSVEKKLSTGEEKIRLIFIQQVVINKTVSEYIQEISQSHTADQPTTP